MKTSASIAIVGASGMVGRQVLSILEERRFPVSGLKLFSSAKSAGKRISFQNNEYSFLELNDHVDFSKEDFVFFTAGSAISEKYAKKIADQGVWVIDNASRFRMDADVSLIVPEINAHAIAAMAPQRLIANPNCTTAQMVMALKPLQDRYGLKRVSVASYQAVSGKGQQGLDEFQNQLQCKAEGKTVTAKAFSHPIAFNCIPQIDTFQDNGYTGEEMKVINETRKILELPNLRVTATCVRVPVWNGHSEAVQVETENEISSLEEARQVLGQMPGVEVWDEPSRMHFPLAEKASGKDAVFVGRLRYDHSLENPKKGLHLWIVADNLRKGAALNAVQIAEHIHRNR